MLNVFKNRSALNHLEQRGLEILNKTVNKKDYVRTSICRKYLQCICRSFCTSKILPLNPFPPTTARIGTSQDRLGIRNAFIRMANYSEDVPKASDDVPNFHSVLRKSRNIVAIAGAGLSAASGIPTFRGAGGLWKSHNAMELATPRAFSENPSRVWQFYHYRREKALEATPNAAHFALAVLLDPEHLKIVAPDAKFTLVTQNIDGLSIRALQQTSPSKKSDLYEMHGSLFETICTACGERRTNTDSPICPAFTGTEEDSEKELDIPLENLPRCTQCAGLLRPGVVWFDEIPRYLVNIGKAVDEADLALIIGTSSTVYPAAGYAYEIAERGGTVAVFNIERSEGDEDADFLFLGPCEVTLPKVLLGIEVDRN